MKNYFDVPKILGCQEPMCKKYRGALTPMIPLCGAPDYGPYSISESQRR